VTVVSPDASAGHKDGMTTTEETHEDRRSIRELVDQLSDDVRRLVRAEVGVVRAELEEKVRRLAVGAALVVLGGVLGLLMLGAATATAIVALANVLATWLAALIVTVVLAVVAGVALLVGVKIMRRGVPPAPTESVDSIKEDVSWVKARARSGAT
jgi:Putative Actinobacterial Holin-X, holin superfamily III